MAINWFPGHMHKARKEIKKIMPQMDLIIEVLDARIPFSSENPLDGMRIDGGAKTDEQDHAQPVDRGHHFRDTELGRFRFSDELRGPGKVSADQVNGSDEEDYDPYHQHQ